jgi:urease gamma subunit
MKGVYISLIIMAVLAVAGIGAYFYFTGSSETVAYLNIESGGVQVNPGNGWQSASDQMELKKDYSVKTLDDGQASIVFFESDTMELDPNTEVQIAQLVANQVTIGQKSGQTWNRVNKLTGTREYSVETPNSVATVRGTGFGVNVTENGDEIAVDDGTVQCGSRDGKTVKDIIEYRKCMVKNGQVSEGEVSREQLLIMKKRIGFAINILERLQMREIAKKRFMINILKKRYNFTDDDLKQFIHDVNTGKKDLNELRSKFVLKSLWVEKIARITGKIVELNKKIEHIDEKLASAR